MAEVRYVWHGDRVTASIRRELRKRLRTVVAETRSHIVHNLSVSARRGGGQNRAGSSLPGEYPRASRGFLRKSVFGDLVSDDTGIVGVLQDSPARKYARRLEEGGNIVAHGKLMAIPISWEAKQHSESGQGPRTFDRPLTRIKRPGKTMLLVEIPTKRSGFGAGVVESTRAAWIIHYVLSPIIRILPRPFISRGVNEMLPRIEAILEAPMTL
jgi:hypothetical protein